MVQSAVQQIASLQLKGRLFTLTVMSLHPGSLATLRQQLLDLLEQAPKLLDRAPLVLDLQAFKGASFDLKGVVDVIREVGLVPVAVQHASVIQQKAAYGCGLAALSAKEASKTAVRDIPAEMSEQPASVEKMQLSKSQQSDAPELPPTSGTTKLITQQIRSGQQVYAKGGDLIVMAGVSAGAEVIADGHIHVYGVLRGRALAGAQGNVEARIFCRELQAELVSIAGQFKMLDGKIHTGGARQVWLADDRIHIGEC